MTLSHTALYFILISLLLIDFLFEHVLEYLNHKNSLKPVPTELSDVYKEEEYKKSQAYHSENFRFGFFSDTFSFFLSFIVIATGFLGEIDAYVSVFENPIFNSLMFFGFVFIVSDILSLPFSLYSVFRIEEKYGFNKMDLKTFFLDKIKGYLLGAVLGGGILYVLLTLINTLGENFWLYFWVIISALVLIINMFYTSLIVPLFNKLTPLEEGELKDAIVEYSKKVDFPLENIFVIDGSKRSTKANAYFSGIGSKKKIVLFDTLIKNHSIEELVAVLAHEAGHFKRKHIIYTLIFSVLQIGITLFLLSKFIFNAELSMALGASDLSIHLNLIAFSLLFTPISKISGLGMMIFSRKNEFEADEFAATTYGPAPLVTALKKLSSDNLSNLTPHPWYVFFNYSHPPLIERVKALKKYF